MANCPSAVLTVMSGQLMMEVNSDIFNLTFIMMRRYMIKEFEQTKTNEVMRIWSDTTIHSHDFIPEKYWVDNAHVVREQYLPIAKTFIYDEDNIVKGFISIMEGFFIGALFVGKAYQRQGIGLKLINYCKKLYPKLRQSTTIQLV